MLFQAERNSVIVFELRRQQPASSASRVHVCLSALPSMMTVLGCCRMKDCYLLREQESNLQWQRIQSPRCYHQWTSRIMRLWQQSQLLAPRPRLERGKCPDSKSGGSANSPSGEHHKTVGGRSCEVYLIVCILLSAFLNRNMMFSGQELEAEAGFEPLMRV